MQSRSVQILLTSHVEDGIGSFQNREEIICEVFAQRSQPLNLSIRGRSLKSEKILKIYYSNRLYIDEAELPKHSDKKEKYAMIYAALLKSTIIPTPINICSCH